MADITANETNIDTRKGGRLALFAEFWSYFSENRGAVMGLWFFGAPGEEDDQQSCGYEMSHTKHCFQHRSFAYIGLSGL